VGFSTIKSKFVEDKKKPSQIVASNQSIFLAHF
jgi:hypothetical protein